MISAILRHGMPLPNVIQIIDKLHFDGDDTTSMSSWKNGVKRMIKKYIKDGTTIKGEVCPVCGSPMIFKEGCKSCSVCSHSVCE